MSSFFSLPSKATLSLLARKSTPLSVPLVGVFVIAQCITIGVTANQASTDDVLLLWQWMLLFFLIFGATTSFTNSPVRFFSGGTEFAQTPNDAYAKSKQTSFWTLTMSSFITWVFAKSVYNASNLGAAYGWVGGLAYAMYYISFLSCATTIYYHRKAGFSTFPMVMHTKYGPGAALAFLLGVAYRLENEVWSNAIVVGQFYGEPGSSGYAAGLIIGVLVPLFYVFCGGMRMSLYTDLTQAIAAIVFLVILLGILGTRTTAQAQFAFNPVPGRNMWSLSGGFDLVIVAFLQGGFSYPFFDPVLTDRAFLLQPRPMWWAFVVGGAIAAAYIFAFSFLGVYGAQIGVGGNPLDVARAIAPAFYQFVALIMITSSLSTLDSTFVSTGKAFALEIWGIVKTGTPKTDRGANSNDVQLARAAQLFMLCVGLLPCIANPAVLNATTLAGTVIIGLSGPVIGGLFVGPGTNRMVYRLPLAFHMSFWCGVILGILLQVGVAPQAFYIGTGDFSLLLGYNLYGLLLCWAFFFLGLLLHAFVLPKRVVAMPQFEPDPVDSETSIWSPTKPRKPDVEVVFTGKEVGRETSGRREVEPEVQEQVAAV